MIDWSLIKRTIYQWAEAEARRVDGTPANYDFIWENQSEMRPPLPYGSLSFLSGPIRIFQDELRKEGNDFLNSGLREITVQVNLYGVKAFEVSEFLMGGIERPTVLDKFNSGGLAYISVSSVRNLTYLNGSKFESRFQFDVRFRVAHNFVDTEQGWFDKVEFTNELNNKSELIDP